MARLCVLGFLLLAATASASLSGRVSQKVTPVEKVIELIKKLSTQVAEEGKKEAADYDKFACWCKEQADEKIYNIEKSEAKIAKLTAKIEELATQITKLEGDIGELNTQINGLDDDIKNIIGKREGDHDDYLGRNKEITDAISALERAIAALKDSRGNMGGDSKTTNLVQLQSMALRLIELSSSSSMVAPTDSQMSVLSQLSAPGKPHAYTYQSNDIIGTLEELKKTFKQNKAENDEAEFRSKSASDNEKLSKSNEKKFAEKDKAEKEALSADKSDEKASNEEDRQSERDAKNADNAFMKELTSTCEDRADQFDQRSKMRSDELTALSQALEKLEEGVQPNYDANKKLTGLLQRSSKPVKGHWQWVEEKATSFLQIRGSSRVSSSQVTQRVMEVLQQAADRTHSPVLSLAAVKVMAEKDHFFKVRTLIKNLIAKLKADAKAEAKQQGFCATNMARATASRDDANAKIESATADISKADAETAALNEETADLEAAIAENMKALNEAIELRDEENKENEQTVDDAGAGKEAVTFALTTLKTFYDNAFIQTGYTPPNADRSGKSVSDMAPAGPDSTYHGNKAQSGGIIGMLEVILSDFDRTIGAVTAEEADRLSKFNKFEKDTKGDNTAKTNTVNGNKRKVGVLGEQLTSLKQDNINAKEQLRLAKEELEDLEGQCVKGEETYAERVAAREQEIQALKDAMDILIAWQG